MIKKIYLFFIKSINLFLDFLINQATIKRKIILCLVDLFFLSITTIYTSNVLNSFSKDINLLEFKFYFAFLFFFFIPLNIFSDTYKTVSKYIQSWILYQFLIKNFLLFFIGILVSKTFGMKVPNLGFLVLIIISLSTILSLYRLLYRDYLLASKKYKNLNLKRTVIYGAGSAGASLFNLISDSNNIIGFIDDDKKLWGRNLYNRKIYNPKEIFLKKKNIDQVLIAIPTLTKKRFKQIINFLNSKDVVVMKVPTLDQILDDSKKISDLQNLNIEDLLGRDEIYPNQDLLHQAINDKIIMITGAAGSIGSELALKVIKLNPKKVILVDINESSLYTLEQQIKDLKYVLPEILFRLGDIKFEPFLTEIFKNDKVDIVFHAAAYKHVPLVEENPIEGIRNNIFSTFSLFKLTNDFEVGKVVLISSDKAVRPSNIMGCSKRVCELIFLYLPIKNKVTKYSIVRFGNVIGSSGSVVPLFNKQLKEGGPITLTDPKITRYFMTISEASELVIQSSTLTIGGEIFLLDMGEPVSIFELAKNMIRLSGMKLMDKSRNSDGIEIKSTGLRPGEKMYEELLIEPNSVRTSHPLIFKAKEELPRNLELEKSLKDLDISISNNDKERTLKIIKTLVPEWKKYKS